MSKLHVCIGHKHFSGGVEKLALACRLLNSGAGDSCKRDRDPDQYVCLFTYFLIDQGQLLFFPLLSGDHNTYTVSICCNCDFGFCNTSC